MPGELHSPGIMEDILTMKKSALERTSVQLSGIQLARIAAEAEENGESVSEIIRRAIDRYFFLRDIVAAAGTLGKLPKEKRPIAR